MPLGIMPVGSNQHLLPAPVGGRRAMLETLFRHLPMVRLRASAALALAGMALGAAACAGDITTPGGGGDDPAVAAAKTAFTENVSPILDGFCGACHVGMANVDFMRPEPDARTRILTWEGLVDLSSPSSSLLINKGPHTGPALTPDQNAVFLDWLELEAVAAGGEPAEVVETDRVTPTPGTNTVDLGAIGLTGSTLTFLYEPLSTGMYLSDIQVVGGTGGAHLVNPLFVIWQDEVAEPDPINRFGNVDMTVAEGATAFVGGGTAVFVDVAPNAPISIHFRVAEFADGTVPDDDDGIIGGGCNNVAQFTANAQMPLNASCASGCHGGANAGARAAVDMSQMADLTADGQAAACGQIKTRINTADPINSGLFLAADPNSGTAHPFKFGTTAQFEAFRTSITNWLNQE
jgi:hypothetical protein